MSAQRRVVLCIGLIGASCVIAAAVLVATGSRGTAIKVPSAAPASWGKAIEVPGTAALNRGGHAAIDSISCGSAGNCNADGDYRVGVTDKGFAVSENDGVWRTAVPAANRSAVWEKAYTYGIGSACTKPGFCVAGGSYREGHGTCGVYENYCYQASFATETNGVWQKAIEVPGTEQLDPGGDGSLDAISCWSTGNCTAAGTYSSDGFSDEGFVVDERNGVWGTAVKFRIPYLSLTADGGYGIDELFCDSARSCAAVGHADFGEIRVDVFVANKTNGVWGKAIPVPGLEPLEHDANDALIRSLSCTTSRFCTAGGESSVVYDSEGTHTDIEPFLLTEKNGVWGDAFTLPDFDDLNAGKFSDLFSISCATATSCAAGGSYTDGAHRQHAFVVSEKNGTWNTAIEVPGLAALNVGHNENGSDAEVDEVVCAKASSCTAGGFYTDRAGHQQAFVTAP